MEFTFVNDDDDWELPSYSDKGIIVVECIGPCPTSVYKWGIDRTYYDADKSPFWVNEGVGIDYWVDSLYPEGFGEGIWTFTGVCCRYIKGDGWMTDDDEEWEYDECRPATVEEIELLD